MTVDTTLEFEKKRNRPVKYDRELMQTTIKAMKRISEIKANRETRLHEKRLKGKKKQEVLQSIKELRQFKDVIRPPTATKPTLLQIRAAQRLQKKKAAESLDGSVLPQSMTLNLPEPVQKAS